MYFQVSLSNSKYTAILKGLHNAISLDYHYEKGLIFWSDLSMDIIRRATINGTGSRGRLLLLSDCLIIKGEQNRDGYLKISASSA